MGKITSETVVQTRLTKDFRNLIHPGPGQSLTKLDVDDAILDGEVICLDSNGVSQFNHLINRRYEPVFYAFDLLWLDGKDLRKLSLLERKERLEKLIKKTKYNYKI